MCPKSFMLRVRSKGMSSSWRPPCVKCQESTETFRSKTNNYNSSICFFFFFKWGISTNYIFQLFIGWGWLLTLLSKTVLCSLSIPYKPNAFQQEIYIFMFLSSWNFLWFTIIKFFNQHLKSHLRHVVGERIGEGHLPSGRLSQNWIRQAERRVEGRPGNSKISCVCEDVVVKGKEEPDKLQASQRAWNARRKTDSTPEDSGRNQRHLSDNHGEFRIFTWKREWGEIRAARGSQHKVDFSCLTQKLVRRPTLLRVFQQLLASEMFINNVTQTSKIASLHSSCQCTLPTQMRSAESGHLVYASLQWGQQSCMSWS